MKERLQKEGRSQAPGRLRVSMPKASARELHQRNGNGGEPVGAGCVQGRPGQSAEPSGHPRRPEGTEPISSEPAPSHRPWASAAGATRPRTTGEHGNCRARRETATEAAAPDAAAPASTSLPTRSLPREDLGNPRRPVDRYGGGCPAQRSWMSPLGARPLADRFQTTTRRKTPACLVTFLRDPTSPVSVTFLYDLTRFTQRRKPGAEKKNRESVNRPAISRLAGRLRTQR